VPAIVEHPSWCDRIRCTATASSGFHWSRPAALDPDPRTKLGVTVQLGQGTPVPDWPDSGVPLVDLTVQLPGFDATDTADEYTLVLRGVHAVALGRMLISAGREAGG
jgi:hypothetical protein